MYNINLIIKNKLSNKILQILYINEKLILYFDRIHKLYVSYKMFVQLLYPAWTDTLKYLTTIDSCMLYLWY